MNAPERYQVRRWRPEDTRAVYEVCLKTGDSGQDATGQYEDPEALGNIYVGPYMEFEPGLAWVLEDAEGVCGYVLGALRSGEFYNAYVERWLPGLRARHPCPKGDPGRWSATEKAYYQYYYPEVYFPETFAGYPSHMHIDLLPRAQGQGQGKRMTEVLLRQLAEMGSGGVHLAMAGNNRRAEGFYRRMGFEELERVTREGEETIYMGRLLERVSLEERGGGLDGR